MGFRTIFRSRLLIALGLTIGLAAFSEAQDKSYVLISGIPGGSQDPSHLDWIDAYALSHVSANTGTSAPSHSEISVLKGTDAATSPLLDRLSRGTNLGTVRIEVCRIPTGGGSQQCYYKLTLEQAKITNVALSGSSCIDPTTSCTPSQTESVTFSFEKITWAYINFSGGKNNCACWDVIKSTTCGCTP